MSALTVRRVARGLVADRAVNAATEPTLRESTPHAEVPVTQSADDEAARRGILKQLVRHGGAQPIRDLHEFSTLRYGRGHQAFSQLMEGLVESGLVSYDGAIFQLTEAGRKAGGSMLV